MINPSKKKTKKKSSKKNPCSLSKIDREMLEYIKDDTKRWNLNDMNEARMAELYIHVHNLTKILLKSFKE
jgi:uncharacterized membrane protein SpoIIM required for sporulation